MAGFIDLLGIGGGKTTPKPPRSFQEAYGINYDVASFDKFYKDALKQVQGWDADAAIKIQREGKDLSDKLSRLIKDYNTPPGEKYYAPTDNGTQPKQTGFGVSPVNAIVILPKVQSGLPKFESMVNSAVTSAKGKQAAYEKELAETKKKEEQAKLLAARSSAWGQNLSSQGRTSENEPDVVSGAARKADGEGGVGGDLGGRPNRRRLRGLAGNLGIVV